MLGAVKLNSLGKSGSKPYWSLTYQGTGNEGGNSNSFTVGHASIDSSNNVYYSVTSASPTLIGTVDIIVIKLNELGVVQWTTRIGASATTYANVGIDVIGSRCYVYYYIADSTYRVYTLATSNGSSDNFYYATYVGASTGAVVLNAGRPCIGYNPSSSQIFYYGRLSGATNSSPKYIHRISTNLTSGIQRISIPATTTFIIHSMDSMSDNTTATLGYEAVGSNIGILNVYDTSGALAWSKNFTYSGSSSSQYSAIRGAVKFDSSGNIYTMTRASTPSISVLTKINSSGSVLWTRVLDTLSISFASISIDSSNNVYIHISSGSNFVLMKFDSSGNNIYQRSLVFDSSVSSFTVDRLILSPDEKYFLLAGTLEFSNSTRDGLVMKLPSDGSRTGTWNVSATGTSNVTYSASSISILTSITTVLTNQYSFTTTVADGNVAAPIKYSGVTTSTNGLNAVKVKI